MGVFTKKFAAAAASCAALFIALALLACDPLPSSGSTDNASLVGASSDFTTFSVAGFDAGPNTAADPDGEYTLITDLSGLTFSDNFAEGGAVAIDTTKPVYKADIGSPATTWYLWVSAAPSRYILSREDTSDLWYFQSAPAAAADTPDLVTTWNKAAGVPASGNDPAAGAPTAAELAAGTSTAPVIAGASVSLIPVTGITLDQSAASVDVGSTLQLSAAVAPANASNKKVTWSSGNASVATVDAAGLVTGVAAGSAVITAAAANASYSANATITVRDPSNQSVPVTGVSITFASGNSDSIFVGDTTALAATVTPANADNPSVTWASSDETVATVDTAGVVMGLAAGTADITAASTDGSNITSNQATITVVRPVTISGQPAAAYTATSKKLSFSVTFDQAVTVTTSGGTPHYKFAVTKSSGATPINKTAAYASGSGTSTLVFEYTKEDGVFGTVSAAADPIDLNGGSLAGATVSRVSLSGITANASAASIAADVSAVGVANAAIIPNASLSASSEYTGAGPVPAINGRLNGPNGWGPATATVGQWWQVDMGSVRDIVRVATQGRGSNSAAAQWITTYKLQYSPDGTTWTDYNSGQVLTGNTNQGSVVTANLTLFSARYVRFLPQTWNGYPVGRFEVYEGK